jgi:formylglycine-generating enzyme required for sulfatase activity
MKTIRRASALLVTLAGASGCLTTIDLDRLRDAGGFVIPTGDDGGTLRPDGAPGEGGCSGGMVRIYAATPFCIDGAEVTNEEYGSFLTAKGSDVGGQPSQCRWNSTYTPEPWPASPGSEPLAVTGVDWCDAFMYCAWAGKHVCGRVGGGAGTVAEISDPSTGEWASACAEGDIHPGDGAEWQDACEAGTAASGVNDECASLGPSCGQAATRNRRSIHLGNLGFRCCL